MFSKSKKFILLFALIGIFIGIMIKNVPIIKGYADFLSREYYSSTAIHGSEPEVIQISSNLSRQEVGTVSKSANSAVRILSRDQYGMVAASTGTVFEYNDEYYVVTVAHGIVGVCETTIIWVGQSNFVPCKNIIAIDRQADFSIIRIDEPTGVEAISLKKVLPRSKQWNDLLSLQNKIFYTGFPNSVGPLTISGRVIGFSDDGYVFVHSYAWSGSSGSGVFSSDGKFIGIVMAVDVGQTVYGVDVLEDMVVILPANRIDWDSILL